MLYLSFLQEHKRTAEYDFRLLVQNAMPGVVETLTLANKSLLNANESFPLSVSIFGNIKYEPSGLTY